MGLAEIVEVIALERSTDLSYKDLIANKGMRWRLLSVSAAACSPKPV
jgi:hypothetical protein